MSLDRVAHDGPVWRNLSAARADDPTGPAWHPEERFKHSGQSALHASLSVESAGMLLTSQPMTPNA